MLHEAELAANLGLPSKITPAIVAQVARYRASSTDHAERLAADYPALCRDLVRLDALRRVVRTARSLDAEALPARETRSWLRWPPAYAGCGSTPSLALFCLAATPTSAMRAVPDELRGRHGLRVYAVGKPDGRTTAAFRRLADASTAPTPDTA